MRSIDPNRIQELYPIGTIVSYCESTYIVTGYTKDGKKLRLDGYRICQLEYHPVYYLPEADTPPYIFKECTRRNITPIFMVNYIGPKL